MITIKQASISIASLYNVLIILYIVLTFDVAASGRTISFSIWMNSLFKYSFSSTIGTTRLHKVAVHKIQQQQQHVVTQSILKPLNYFTQPAFACRRWAWLGVFVPWTPYTNGALNASGASPLRSRRCSVDARSWCLSASSHKINK
jgi:hypothetical protein